MLINISIPKLETAEAVNANTPGAAKNIIQSVIFIVAANTDSKKATIGLFTSPTFANATANIRINTIIETIWPEAKASKGLLGMKSRNMFNTLPCCSIAVVTVAWTSDAVFAAIYLAAPKPGLTSNANTAPIVTAIDVKIP